MTLAVTTAAVEGSSFAGGRAVPVPRPEIPALGADVTVSWVAEALESGGVPLRGRLRSVRAEPLALGRGLFGELTRLRLVYDRRPPEAPRTVILKLASPWPTNRARAQRFRLDEREVCFYRNVAPTLEFRVPRCFWSALDVARQRSGLLLEDLGGFGVADDLVGVGPDRAGLAVERLARAHGQWWQDPRLRALTWMPSFGDDVVKQVAGLCRELWQPFVALHGASLPERSVGLGHRVVEGLEKLLDDVSRPPVTIVHGDFRLDNLFFGAASKHDAVAAVDWQLACRGKGAFDVAYLLGQGMPVEPRRRHEMAILRRWHGALRRRGVRGYSFDAAVADYRRCALVCVAWAVAGTALERGDERGRLLARAQAERSFAAAVDLEADVFLTP